MRSWQLFESTSIAIQTANLFWTSVRMTLVLPQPLQHPKLRCKNCSACDPSIDKSTEEADSTKAGTAEMGKEYEALKDSTKAEEENAGNNEEPKGKVVVGGAWWSCDWVDVAWWPCCWLGVVNALSLTSRHASPRLASCDCGDAANSRKCEKGPLEAVYRVSLLTPTIWILFWPKPGSERVNTRQR
ncbi:Secretogranin-3, partial [Ophiophagus hannah]